MDQATIVEFAKAVALLLALCLLHGLIARRWKRGELVGQILSGTLFGGICVIGMMTPIEVTPGVIFDARSVILSMAGLFGGPVVGGIAAVIAGGYRLWLGGGGVLVGVSVVACCVLLGLAYRYACQRGWLRTGFWQLLAFGFLVHLFEVYLFTFLPEEVVAKVMENVAVPLILTFAPATALLGMLLQSTEQQLRTARSLAESEARFRDVAEISGDWIWEMDSDLRFTFVSPRFFQLYPFETGSIIGKSREDLAKSMRDKEGLRTHLESLRRREAFRDFEYVVTERGGEVKYASISGKPVFNASNEFCGYRGTGSDITARKLAEAEIVASREAAVLANRAKSEFLANMSHELRTPLNSILGYSEMLINEIYGPMGHPKYAEYASAINVSGGYLFNIISDILDISKIEAGEATVEEVEVDVGEAIRSGIAMVEVRAQQKALEIEENIPASLPSLCADARHVKQIVLNLLSNAVKFTPKGGRLAVNARLTEDSAIEISVADTGIGIRTKDISRVLQPFTQVAESHNRSHEGTGLGLPICNSLMDLHGGSLEIQSEVGIGTIATVSFPPERTIISTKASPIAVRAGAR